MSSAAFVLGATLAACGGGGGDGSAGGDPGATTVAGNVISVFNRLALVDGERVAGGDPIRPGAVLSTDLGGAATFSVGRKLDDCQIRPESAAQVLPQPGVLLEYQKGWTLCRSTPGDFERAELTAKSRRIAMQDPVWAVGAFPGSVSLRVFRGFVELRAVTGPGRLVGPDSQAIAPDGGEAGPAEHFDRSQLDQLDRQGVERMEASLPAPAFGFPSSAGSPVLTEIRRRGSLRLGIDSSRSAQSATFIAGFFDFLAQHWNVSIEVVVTRRPATDLAQGRVDVAVVPGPVGAAGIPFFDDDQQGLWSILVSDEEAALLAALRTFLLGALDIGEYGRRYRGAFGKVPSYEAVRPLVLPDPPVPVGPTTSTPAGPTSLPSTTQPATTTLASTSTSTTSPPATTTSSAPPAAFSVQIANGSATAPSPSAPCPATVNFVWTIRANGPGTITYRFTRSDGATSSAPLSMTFDRAGTQTANSSWTLGVTPFAGWVALEILSPQPLRSQVDFTFTCTVPSTTVAPPK